VLLLAGINQEIQYWWIWFFQYWNFPNVITVLQGILACDFGCVPNCVTSYVYLCPVGALLLCA